MNSLLVRQYQETKSKYLKFYGRLQNSYKTGTFYRLPERKQNWLIIRVRKLWEKLKFLEKQLKLAIAAGTLTLLLSFNDSIQAQPNFVPAPDKNPLAPPLVYGKYPAVFDVDADGDVDILTTQGNDYIVWYKNVGTSSEPDFIKVPDDDNPFQFPDYMHIETQNIKALADIDGDGDLDLFTDRNDYSFFTNSGTAENPVFEPADNPVGGVLYENLVDIDGDGDLDMVDAKTSSYYNYYSKEYADSAYIKVIINAGTPEFPIMATNMPFYLPVANEPQGEQINISGNVPLDFDKDGDIDFLVSSTGYSDAEDKYYIQYRVILNEGSLQYPFFSYLEADYPFKDFLFYIDEYYYDENTVFPVDLDNDGDLDFLVSKNEIELAFYRNNKLTLLIDNSIEDFQGYLLNPTYNISPVFLDYDGDGDYDMYTAFEEENIPGTYYENTGDRFNPQFTPSEDYFPFLQTDDVYYFTLLFVDIDNDSDLDCFAVNEEYYSTLNWNFYKNIGTLQSPDYILDNYNNPLPGIEEIFTLPSFADLDSDGDKDMILIITDFEAYDYWSHISYYKNTIGPEGITFTENIGSKNPFNDIEVDDAIDVNPFVAADLDMDGDNDVFFVKEGDYYYYDNNSIVFLHNIGTPSSPLFKIDEEENPFKDLKIGDLSGFCLVDLDGDGDKDLFCTSFDNQILNYYINTDPRANSSGDKQIIPKNSSLKVFPNPASDNCILNIQGPVTGLCELKVLDIYGRVMKTESFEKLNGQVQHQLEISSLVQGIYLIEVTQGDQRYLTRLIVE
jgi:hypothetical protein